MKKNILFSSILLLMITLQGCGIPNIFEKTKVEGKVINLVTGMPISNIKVIVQKSNFSLLEPGLLDIDIIDETTTDQNGHFSFRFNAKVASSYTCIITEESIPFYGNHNVELSLHSDNAITFQIAPAGKIDYFFKNVNCIDANDSLRFTEKYAHLSDCCGIDTLIVQGCNIRDVQPLNRPMGEYYFWWEVRRGGVANEFRDTIYLEAGAERLYEVQY